VARVNLEQRLFGGSRLDRLGRTLDVPRCVALGLLADLWNESQEEERSLATASEIYAWARLYQLADWMEELELTPPTEEALIDALTKSQFIRPEEDGKYRICGNEEQIDGLKKHLEKKTDVSRKGGEARAAAGERDEHGRYKPKAPADIQPGPSSHPAVTSQPSSRLDTGLDQRCQPPASIQFNSIQDNSIQSSSTQNSEEEESREGGGKPPRQTSLFPKSRGENITRPLSDTDLTWRSWAAAYQLKYGVKPLCNPKVMGQCKELFKRLKGATSDVIDFYLSHPDAKYAGNQHPLGMLVMHAETIHDQWQRGSYATMTAARQVETQAHNAQVIRDYVRDNPVEPSAETTTEGGSR